MTDPRRLSALNKPSPADLLDQTVERYRATEHPGTAPDPHCQDVLAELVRTPAPLNHHTAQRRAIAALIIKGLAAPDEKARQIRATEKGAAMTRSHEHTAEAEPASAEHFEKLLAPRLTEPLSVYGTRTDFKRGTRRARLFMGTGPQHRPCPAVPTVAVDAALGPVRVVDGPILRNLDDRLVVGLGAVDCSGNWAAFTYGITHAWSRRGVHVAEMRAVLLALRLARTGPVRVLTDSASAVRYCKAWAGGHETMPRAYEPADTAEASRLNPIHLEDLARMMRTRQVEVEHVPGRRGNIAQEAADTAARRMRWSLRWDATNEPAGAYLARTAARAARYLDHIWCQPPTHPPQ